jgi:hypothetical protein
MKERGWIEPIVERVVGQVLQSHVAQLRTEIVRRVMEEVEAATQPGDSDAISASSSSSSDLARAVSEIQAGTSQREILRALLDVSARYAARVALFVVKGSHATGWQGRGFSNGDAIKDFALDENAPAITRVIGNALRRTTDQEAASLPVADMDTLFFQQVGMPASGDALILPLILKDKVAALVYADSGTDAPGSLNASSLNPGLLDAGTLELLVLSTSAWLEVNSLRKQAHKEPSGAHADGTSIHPSDAPTHRAHAQSAPASPAFPAFNDPFAAHTPAFTPAHARAAAASAGETSGTAAGEAVAAPSIEGPSVEAHTMVAHNAIMETQSAIAPLLSEVQSAIAEMEPALAEPLPVSHVETAPAPPPDSIAAISPEDQEIHRKAQRFARLLVDEIKLYNQAQVAEGRQNRDIYDRLKEVIDKSRATYHKRYGNTVAASATYLEREIMRSLAEDDPSIMGANFRQ